MPRQIRYNIAASLDGYIASANHTTPWITDDPSIDFPALYAQFALFVMGRRTWSTMVSMGTADPFQGSELRSKVLVLSSDATLKEMDMNGGVRTARGDVCQIFKAEVERLGNEGEDGDIWVMGGARIVGELIKGGMLGTIEVAVMPVVLGEGVKMLEGLQCADEGIGMKLEGCEVKESGILMTRYRVVGGACAG